MPGGQRSRGEIGILCLDTRFPRIHGDVGNPRSFDVPVRIRVVPGASVDRIVAPAERARALLPAFVETARALEADGVGGIATSCGFLSVVQAELAAAVRVPVVSSALMLVPLVRSMVAGRPVGVVTADATCLSAAHLVAAGIDPHWAVPVRGLEDAPAFRAAILAPGAGVAEFDAAAVGSAVEAACRALCTDHPDLGAFVFECTNLQPHAAAVERSTGRPVFGIVALVEMLGAAIRPRRYDGRV